MPKPWSIFFAAVVGLPIAACNDSTVKTPAVERVPEAEANARRADCEYRRGALPAETLGEEVPVGQDIPIDHFILLMLENRSFDHYFGTMEGVDGIPEGFTMPDANGDPVAPFHETRYCIEDVRHGWNDSHVQYNEGANDGFVVNNDPNGARALGYFTEEDLPFYHDLYKTFAMSDRHFCSMLGPTWPNRMYYMAGTSFGFTNNQPVATSEFYDSRPHHVFDALDQAGVEWRLYFSDLPTPIGLFPAMLPRVDTSRTIDTFLRDLEDGDLAPVTYLDPSFTAGVEQTDEHPPASPQFGQAFVKMIVEALMQSEFWSRSALIITYDEHGGFFDHVPPPPACAPDDHEPRSPAGTPYRFDRLGFRVPLVVVSPYAKAGYVSHQTTDLTSVLRLVATRFGLPALTKRDANAWPLLDMFDFENPPHMNPPALVDALIDDERTMTCHDEFPNSGSVF
jgi:phospholipase C